MQSTRSETLLNVVAMSVALLVSYAAPRLVGAAAPSRAVAPAQSTYFRGLERAIASDGDDDDDGAGSKARVGDGLEREVVVEVRGVHRPGNKHGFVRRSYVRLAARARPAPAQGGRAARETCGGGTA